MKSAVRVSLLLAFIALSSPLAGGQTTAKAQTSAALKRNFKR